MLWQIIHIVGAAIFWAGIALLVMLAVMVVVEEVKLRVSARSKMKQQVLKAERQIHDLAVAAFAEMLDEARFGQLDRVNQESKTLGESATGEVAS